MFKVGDKVLIKGEVVEVAKDVTYPIGVRLRCATVPMLFTEEELELSTKTYEMGLNDAWELAKKIYHAPCDGGYSADEIKNIFGCTIGIMSKFTAEQALAKIEAYEKEKEINIGSIVRVKDEKGEAIVTAICPTGVAYVMWKDGSGGDYELSELETTGRTVDGLEVLLRQIKE